jgi:hypothetical protein
MISFQLINNPILKTFNNLGKKNGWGKNIFLSDSETLWEVTILWSSERWSATRLDPAPPIPAVELRVPETDPTGARLPPDPDLSFKPPREASRP